VVNVRSIKPLDSAAILRQARLSRCVVTVEDNVLAGGFGSSILELLSSEPGIVVTRIGYPDEFIPQGPITTLHERYGLTAEGIARAVRSLLGQDMAAAAAKGD